MNLCAVISTIPCTVYHAMQELSVAEVAEDQDDITYVHLDSEGLTRIPDDDGATVLCHACTVLYHAMHALHYAMPCHAMHCTTPCHALHYTMPCMHCTMPRHTR